MVSADRRSARPPRLTRRELDGLWSAWLSFQGEVDDQEDPIKRRELVAAERALRKIEASAIAPPTKAAR